MSLASDSVPSTKRGRRTRGKLIEAGETVFVRDGFLDARVTDIAAEAGVSVGTFYTYFAAKEDLLRTIIGLTVSQLFDAAKVPAKTGPTPLERIEAATRAWVESYRQNADLLEILEQVATFNSEFRAMRVDIRQTFRNRIVRGLERMQREGTVDAALPAKCVAEALTSMVSNFCYVWLVLGEEYEEESVVRTLTTLWGRGIGLGPEHWAAWNAEASAADGR